MATKVPFPDAVNTSVKLSLMSAAKLKSAKLGLALDIGGTATSFLSIMRIDKARRKAISKYDLHVQQVLNNIADLSRGVSAARAELKRLGYDK